MATVLAIVAVALLLTPAVTSAGTFRWKTDGNGLWNNPANWQWLSGSVGSGFPNGRDDVAVFSFSISADRVVTIPSDTIITIGTLQIAESFNLTIEGAGTAFPGGLIFDSSAASATLDVVGDNHAHQIRAAVELRTDLTVDVFNDGSSLSFFRSITQLGTVPRGVKKAGHGMVRFLSTTSNDYDGTTVVEEGTIEILQSNNIIAIPGDLDIGLASGDSPAGLQVLGGNTVIALTSRVRVLNTGTFDVRQFSQQFASLTIAGGFVSVGQGTTAAALRAASLTMTGGTLNVGTSTARFRLDGPATITSSATQSATIMGIGGLQLGGTTTFTILNGPAENDLMMNLATVDNSLNYGITKDGPGTMRFTGTANNAYTGPTTVLEGRLELARGELSNTIRGSLIIGGAGRPAEVSILESNTIVDTSPISVMAGGVLTVKSAGDRIGSLTLNEGTATLTDAGLEVASLSMTGATLQLATPTSILSLNGPVSGTSTTGHTSVIGGSGTVSLNSAQRTFIVGDGPEEIDLRVDARINGVGTAGITKAQQGVALFTGQNAYTGPTAVNTGTLIVTGTLTSAVSVVTGATLRGTGSVGATAIQNGGTVSPGLSPGLLSSGALSLHPGSRFVVELIGSTVGAGYDQIRVTGSVELHDAQLLLVVGPALSPFGRFTLIDNDGADPVASTFAGLPEGGSIIAGAENGREFTISYTGGDGNDVVLTAAGEVSYFLSEGATGTFFDEDVLISNPNTQPAPVTMTFLLDGGGTVVHQQTVPAQSRATVHVDELPGLESVSASVRVTSDARLPLGVERTMFWDSRRYAGHTANAVPAPRTEWYFAEGAQGFFDTWLLLANANDTSTNATITFMRENEPPFELPITLEPSSRFTLFAGNYPELRDRSFGMKITSVLPISSERAMYFTPDPTRLWTGGHANVASAAPSTSWFHAEGATGGFFTTFILISNPQTAPANVTLRFLLPSGETVAIERTILAQQRITINPAALDDPRLQNTALSTVVTSDQPVVSERAMYWPELISPGHSIPLGEGHVSSGVTNTALIWDLAEGRSRGDYGYNTYILLANPSATPADVEVTFLPEGSGGPIVKTYTLPPTSRFNVDVGSELPELVDRSFGARVRVTNGVGIAVERSLYWSTNGIFWAGGTNALGIPLP